ncbi:MAG: DUF2817 domain-containing protein [Alphaproteobacteria bacterium]|nr:DUF2817 domain-containing protein [Alphaproteobacteria bacterium]
MTDTVACFSDDVNRARDRFLTACDRIGLRITSHAARGDNAGSTGLSCDVARMGSPDATRVAVLCSAAAGSAGLLGCGAILGVLTEGGLQDLPKEVALVLIHAANPAGPIWPYFAPDDVISANKPAPDWSDSVLAAAEERFSAFQAEQGVDWTRMAGQTLASMTPPAWDGAVLRAIAAERFEGAQQVCVIDSRTGPGPFGMPEIVPCNPPNSAGRTRAESWFTINVTAASDAIGAGAAPCGGGLGGLLPKAQVTNVVLEIGTYSLSRRLGGSTRSPNEAPPSYPSDTVWRNNAWQGVRLTLQNAYRGLLRDG